MIENEFHQLPHDDHEIFRIHPQIGLRSSQRIAGGAFQIEFQMDDSQLWETVPMQSNRKDLVKLALHSTDPRNESAWQHPLANEMLFLDRLNESELIAFSQNIFGKQPALFPRVLGTFFRRPLIQIESNTLYPNFILGLPGEEHQESTQSCFGYIQEARGDRLTHAFGKGTEGWHAVWDGLQKSAMTLAYLEHIGMMYGDMKAKQIIQSDFRETTTLVDYEHAQVFDGSSFAPLVPLFDEPYSFSAMNPETAAPEQIADFALRIEVNSDFTNLWIARIAESMQRAFTQYQRFGLPITPEDFIDVEVGASNKTDVFQFAMTILSIVENQRLALRPKVRDMIAPMLELRSSNRPSMLETAQLITSLEPGEILTR